MTSETFKTWVDLVSLIVTTLAILVGGGWFLLRRSLAGKLEATMTLVAVTEVAGAPIGIVNVHLKNVGQTRLVNYQCVIAAEPVWISDDADSLLTIKAHPLNYGLNNLEIFDHLPGLEPGEESSESVALQLKRAPVVEGGLRFTHARWNRRLDTWEWTAFYSAQQQSPDES